MFFYSFVTSDKETTGNNEIYADMTARQSRQTNDQ